MVEFVLLHIREEFGKLVVHISSVAVILDLEVAVPKQRKGCSVPGAELEFAGEDVDDLGVLLVSNEGVDGLGILAVGDRLELLVHI